MDKSNIKVAQVYSLAVLFDAFGTLIKIQNGSHPYRTILKLGIVQGRRPRLDDAEMILSHPLGLAEAATHFGIDVTPNLMVRLEMELNEDLAQLEAYEDALKAVNILQNAGVEVGICSNLALPYAAGIERLYPSIKHHSYSFNIGAIKPNFRLYEHAANSLKLPPQQIWMIGDSIRCDKDGPASFGMKGFHLDRNGEGNYRNLTDFAEDFMRAYFHL